MIYNFSKKNYNVDAGEIKNIFVKQNLRKIYFLYIFYHNFKF